MPIITCTRRFQFCAGHRVYNHESKCRNLHGHNYVLLVTVEAPELDALGRVIDFGEIKGIVGDWIDRKWDHGFILFADDRAGLDALTLISNQKLYVMQSNPTAENMARHLLVDVLPRILPPSIKATQVRLWETENCYADAWN